MENEAANLRIDTVTSQCGNVKLFHYRMRVLNKAVGEGVD